MSTAFDEYVGVISPESMNITQKDPPQSRFPRLRPENPPRHSPAKRARTSPAAHAGVPRLTVALCLVRMPIRVIPGQPGSHHE